MPKTQVPMASIIVPVYNARRTLSRCVESLFDQTCSDIEIILVNDGSTDGSGEECRRYVERDSRVILLEQEHIGSIAARRKGIEAAAAPYVTFADADDWMDERLVERLLSTAKVCGADITVCNTYRTVDGLSLLRKANRSRFFREAAIYEGIRIRDELVTAYLLGLPFPATLHGKLYKRELLLDCGVYLERITFFGDDLFYNLEMMLKSGVVAVIPECLYYYRTGGMTSRPMPSLFQDAVSGFEIQMEVVEKCFDGEVDENARLRLEEGISAMLLRSVLTCLVYLFLSNLSRSERMSQIRDFCSHPVVRKSTLAIRGEFGFSAQFIRFLRESNERGLYRLGRRNYVAGLPRRVALKLISGLFS